MRRFALFIALFASSAFAGQRVMQDSEGDFIRLYDAPCRHAVTMGHIPEEFRPAAQQVDIRLGGKHIPGCWLNAGGVYFIVLEDGRAAPFDATMFTEEPGT